MQQNAGSYLLLNYATCLGRPSRPSSGVHKTIVAAFGTDHTICVASFLKGGQRRTVWDCVKYWSILHTDCLNQSLFGHVWSIDQYFTQTVSTSPYLVTFQVLINTSHRLSQPVLIWSRLEYWSILHTDCLNQSLFGHVWSIDQYFTQTVSTSPYLVAFEVLINTSHRLSQSVLIWSRLKYWSMLHTDCLNQSFFGHVWGSSLPRWYDLYQRLQLQFYVLWWCARWTPETCRVI